MAETMSAAGVSAAVRVAEGNEVNIVLAFTTIDFDGAQGEDPKPIKLERSRAGRNAYFTFAEFANNVDVDVQLNPGVNGPSYDFRVKIPYTVDSGSVDVTLTDVEPLTVPASDMATQIELDDVQAEAAAAHAAHLADTTAAHVASSIGLTVATEADWDVTPTAVKAALDELAARVRALEP